jgi:pyruvate ferredoxin oxidoreductase alpha subunit
MTTLDGFITTHAMERCELLDDATVKDYVGQYVPKNPLINGPAPVAVGMFASLGGTYFEVKQAQRRAIDGSAAYIQQLGDEWADICGRKFDFVDEFECSDADYILVVLGTAAGNARTVAKQLRDQGIKAGVLRIRVYRPFPAREVRQALSNAKAVGILDRSDSFGAQYGPVGLDVRAALYDLPVNIPTRDYIFGLGGADVTLESIRQAYQELQQLAKGQLDQSLSYLGTR